MDGCPGSIIWTGLPVEEKCKMKLTSYLLLQNLHPYNWLWLAIDFNATTADLIDCESESEDETFHLVKSFKFVIVRTTFMKMKLEVPT